MINLANNAVKFTEKGEIVVSVFAFERSESGATLQFSVQDSGIGLTEKQRGKLVLIVDDNQTSREILRNMLETMSFVVSQSASGEEAIGDILEADKKGNPFEVVYMDWQMPGMSGIATTKKIKEHDLLAQPKIIMVTAYGREEIMQQAENVKMDGFLVKLVNRSVLFGATMQAFGREGIRTPGSRITKGG